MAFIFWIAFAALVGALASKWKRNGVLWGILALLISPLLAAIILTIVHLLEKN